MRKRRLVLLAIMAAVVALYFARQNREADVPPQRLDGQVISQPAPGVARTTSSGSDILAIRPRSAADEPVNAFATRSWVPPPRAVILAPEPVKTAPPLPFKFIGRIARGSDSVVFLDHEGLTQVAAVGEVLIESYLLERIEPSQLTFRYLPMGTIQTLNAGTGE